MKIYLHNRLISLDGQIVFHAQSPEHYREALRSVRGALLADSDWTQVADTKLDANTKQAWLEYRQYLRDVSTVSLEELSTGSYELRESPTTGRPVWWNQYGIEIMDRQDNHDH